MYTYTVNSLHDMMEITSYLLRHGIGFRAYCGTYDNQWVIELTGAH